MNIEELRDALEDEARHQSAVSAGLRDGVDGAVRRQRARRALVVAPVAALAVVVLGGGLLLARTPAETTVSTADGSATAAGTTPGSQPATPTSVSVVPGVTGPATTQAPDRRGGVTSTVPDGATPPTTEATTDGGPAPSVPVPPSGDCGTVTVTASASAAVTTDPMTCFLTAFNAGQPATLVVVVQGEQGSELTERLSTRPGKLVSVQASGSVITKVPALSFGGGQGGVFPSEAGTPEDCGTLSTSTASASAGGLGAAAGVDKAVITCLVKGVTSGTGVRVGVELQDESGGELVGSVTLADGAFTLALDGEITEQLPAELQVPEQLLSAIPSGSVSLDGLVPGMGRTKPSTGG